MNISINTDTQRLTIDGVVYEYEPHSEPVKKTIVDELSKYRGDKEYTGIVATIQKWYYGYASNTSWCATCISYFANVCGILDQLGGKHENVYNMMCACKRTAPGRFYDKNNIPEAIKKNDILFWLWSGETMSATSSKHVGVAEYDSSTSTIYCLGGNQKDKVCTLAYDKKFLYAVYRPEY